MGKLIVYKIGKVKVLKIDGNISIAELKNFRKAANDLIKDDLNIAFDFSSTEINTNVLTVLSSVHNRFRKENLENNIIVYTGNQSNLEILRTIGFTKIIDATKDYSSFEYWCKSK